MYTPFMLSWGHESGAWEPRKPNAQHVCKQSIGLYPTREQTKKNQQSWKASQALLWHNFEQFASETKGDFSQMHHLEQQTFYSLQL